MLNSPLIQDLIFKGEVTKIKEVMARSNRLGMKTFDQALFELYEGGYVSYEDALRNADSKNELRLRSSSRASASRRIWMTMAHSPSSMKKTRVGRCSRQTAGVLVRMAAMTEPVESPVGCEFRRVGQAGLNTKPLFKLMVEKKASDLFFTLECADQDQDRRADHSDQQAGAGAGDGAPGSLWPDDARAARVFSKRARDRLRDLGARSRPVPRQRVPPARLSRRWCCATSRRTCRGSKI